MSGHKLPETQRAGYRFGAKPAPPPAPPPAISTDWREYYVICTHVAEDEKFGTRHRGFRVCCEDCYANGGPDSFLNVEPLHTVVKGRLCVGQVQS